MERKALGKGISALIPERETESQERIAYLNPGQIKPNPLQPRKDFDSESLEELMQSIREKGVIQPVLVRRQGPDYELIAGERRWRAASNLNLSEIPVIIKDAQDQDSLEISLIENIQRENLNPIEEARAYQYLMNKFNISQEKISEVLGRSRVSIANILRLLNLPQEIQDEIRKGRIMFAHGRALLEIDDVNLQRRLSQDIIAKGLSVRELENLIKSRRTKLPKKRISPAHRQPYLTLMEEELQHALATKVRIIKRKKRGHINIEFYSDEDLGRIIARIKATI
ncbi:MAG: ParB/RepB/Spo0J family partition protein [Candidatus Omnitrophica bacterium]|nr:ParB/RepB/Spo0J family partition protein [Candidatus Omnitrophota bacterium]